MRLQRTKSEAKYQQLIKWITEEEVRHPRIFRSVHAFSPSVQQYSAGCITASALLHTEVNKPLSSSTYVCGRPAYKGLLSDLPTYLQCPDIPAVVFSPIQSATDRVSPEAPRLFEMFLSINISWIAACVWEQCRRRRHRPACRARQSLCAGARLSWLICLLRVQSVAGILRRTPGTASGWRRQSLHTCPKCCLLSSESRLQEWSWHLRERQVPNHPCGLCAAPRCYIPAAAMPAGCRPD